MKMNQLHTLLEQTKSYLINSIAPNAAVIDYDSQALQKALNGLAELGLLGLRIPQEWGGLAVNQETFDDYQELIARYSGALAFLQTQHQSAAAMISQSENLALKQEYLPLMSQGKRLLGIGFSHLRRDGEPLVKAIPVTGGFLIEGTVPWVTGWKIFSDFIVAATLPNGEAVFGVVPLVEIQQENQGLISFDAPMKLAAMASTNTVAADLKGWFLAQEKVVFIKPQGWIHENDRKSILKQTTFLALGCALAGIDIVEAATKTKSLSFIKESFANLYSEFNHCRQAIKEAQENTDLPLVEKHKLRSWAIALAVRCAHAAITVSSGAANLKSHPAQRVYREALVFTVSGQTQEIKAATLQRLINAKTPQKTIKYSQVIHLSHIIDTNIPQWPGDPTVELETVAELAKDGYYLRRFSLGEHSATHINAPLSFHSSGIGIDRYLASSLVKSAIVIDISYQAKTNPDYLLTINDIWDWEQQNGKITADSILLVYTGWQEKWLDNEQFLNSDLSGQMHFPGISKEAVLFLLKERTIFGLGIDTHGVDSGQDTCFTVNSLMLEKPRIILENLTNLEQLPATGTTLVIGILRLKDGSGSPAAVMAFVP
ncbi:cyclase family protein [Phormidium sp. LEGE 05292]|uniref:cyclase family protein n=1 Tax=[Phormidium] sp. LEGE 05292 TaxID=767427 RepID=UPI0018812C3E|nr:cyclase family protein [Phormidium sp. LEGE 05292]MBE9225146.1 cyclase family protein [Phormidium sp. LEGE 05292]